MGSRDPCQMVTTEGSPWEICKLNLKIYYIFYNLYTLHNRGSCSVAAEAGTLKIGRLSTVSQRGH